MLDKTITSALLQLRAQIIRGKLDGLDHVEALLLARGVELPHVPRPTPADGCAQHEISRAIYTALRGGPKRAGEVVAAFHAQRPDMAFNVVQRRVYRAGEKMILRGVVGRDAGRWRLTRFALEAKTSVEG